MAMDVSTQMRLTGMASGLDTEAVIQNLGKVNMMRINAVQRDKQVALWRQEAYRGVINMLSDFSKSRLNLANPTNNFRSASAFAKFSYELSMKNSSSTLDASKIMSVVANADLKNYNQVVQGVAQLATKDEWVGMKANLQGITTKGFDLENFVKSTDQGIAAVYGVFGVSIDGVSKTIQISAQEFIEMHENTFSHRMAPKEEAIQNILQSGYDGGYFILEDGAFKEIDEEFLDDIKDKILADYPGIDVTDLPLFLGKIHTALSEYTIYTENTGGAMSQSEAFAQKVNEKITALYGSNYKNIVTATADGELKFHKSGSNITIFGQTGFESTLVGMGLPEGGASSSSMNNKKITELFDLSGIFGVTTTATLRINGVNISVSKDDTLSTFASKINSSDAGVTFQYSAATDSFSLNSKAEGSVNNIQDMTGVTAELFEAFGLGTVNNGVLVGVYRHKADNFIGVINGQEFVRQSNTFQYEGMTYTFNETFNAELNADGSVNILNPSDAIKIDVSRNTTDIMDSIKSFVDEYNVIVDLLNGLLNEKRDREFQPLSDDEKKAMKEDDIKAYESKAKLGLMANESDLRKILSEMRTAIYQKVDGVGLTMSDIGITTGPNWKDGGRLVIDEEKLKKSIDNNYDAVVSLFSKSSSISADDKANASKRYNESGIAQRLYDIIESAAGTRGAKESKGYLVQKAGTKNDLTDGDNLIQDKIKGYDKKIQTLMERWYRQENAYYAMFARMETAMSQLQAQQNSLAQIMAQG